MTGLQTFIYQKNNKLINAAITADISPSAKTPLVYPQTKQGTGNIRTQGNYEGSEDALIDVEIVDSAFTDPIVSAPVFKGAGTGKIKDIAASGLEAQKITTLCLSTGISTQKARVEIEGELFEAIPDGAEGNGISISIDSSELVFTLTDYSTIKDLKAGDTALEGQEWDFDTKVILGDIIPDTAHRIAFGGDNIHICRQYKKFEDGKYKYYFITPIICDVKKGSKIYFVTGGRTVTVTDGVTTEEYEDIITIADFWQAVKDLPSALIKPVNSSINTSKTPDSPAVRELAVMTDAYALPAYKSDQSSEYAGELDSIVVKETTRTELIEVKCVDNAYIGEEVWNVKGSSSGDLKQVKTGDFNDVGPVGFTIPQKFPKDWGTVKEDWSVEVTYADREVGDPPPICFAMKQGINSVAQTLTLTYKKKPVDCVCPSVSFSDIYLGFQEKGGEIGMAYTIEDLQFWVDGISEIMKEQYSKVLETAEGRTAAPGEGSFNRMTAEYFSNFKILARRLADLPEDDTDTLLMLLQSFKDIVLSLRLYVEPSAGGIEIPSGLGQRGIRQDFVVGEIVKVPYYEGNGVVHLAGYHYYMCTVAGYVGDELPVWPLVLEETVVDGEVTWKMVSGGGSSPGTRNGVPKFATGDKIGVTINTNLYVYTASITGYPAYIDNEEPVWPTVLEEYIADGDITWTCTQIIDISSESNVNMLWDADNKDWVVIPGTVPAVAVIKDVSYEVAAYQQLVESILEYEKAYGLKKNSVSVSDDGSYQTSDDDYYWEVLGSKAYLPAFTDVPYYSNVKSIVDGVESCVNTKEFAFGISVPCGGTLLEGDVIKVTIGGKTYERTYQIGDITYLPTIAASDLNLVGGIDGDDTFTFEVRGEIDTLPNYLLDRDDPQPYKGTKALAWQAGHSYSLTNYVKAVTFNGCRYECTTAGTSGGTEPTWPTTIGETVNDNGVVWTCRAVELSFEIEDGIIMFQVGDSFEFNIEGGHFKWRKDGGEWSAAIALDTAFQEITEGIEIAFDFGVSPSFVIDDAWEIICLQENKAANMLIPWANTAMKASDHITFAFTEPVTIDSLIIDMHSLTGDVVFEASNEPDFDPLIYTGTISTAELISLIFEDDITAQYFRLKPAGEQTIGYIFLGTMMRLDTDADKITPVKRFSMSRQESPEPFSLFRNKKIGFNVNYSESWVNNDDWEKLVDLIEYLKENNDMPFYFIPNTDYPSEAFRSWIDKDTFDDIGADFDFNVPKANRTFMFTLPLIGVKKQTIT